MAIPLIVAGAAFAGVSAFTSSQAKARQARANAQMAEAAAADALQRGEQRAWQIRETSARRESAQTLAYAHGGVDVATGSPAEVISKTAMVGELEAQIQRNNAFREALGYRGQASSFREAASATETTGYLDMFGAIFGGAGKVVAMGAA